MKRTRFIAIALAVLIAVAFVSCDGDNATPPQKECEHEWGASVEKVPSTCTTVGEAERTCTKCGEKKSEEIPCKPHNYGDSGVVDVEATCATVGKIIYTCTKCGEKKTEVVPRKPHESYDDNYRCTKCSGGTATAGKYVFYDCDEDNDPNINGGRGRDNLMSSECGWRFLEAAPANLRVIKGVPTVDSTAGGYDKATKEFYFGFYRTSPEGENLAIDAKDAVGTGKENTKKFYEAMGEENGYKTLDATKPFIEYPARLCSILEYTGSDGKTYDDWFLPSFEEIKLMFNELDMSGLETPNFQNYFHSSVTRSDLLRVLYYFSDTKDWGGSNGSREVISAFIRPIRAF